MASAKVKDDGDPRAAGDSEPHAPAVAPNEDPSAVAPNEDPPAVAPNEDPPAVAPNEDPPAVAPNEDPPAGSSCSILALNQDCLLKVFGYLPMRDLLSVEKVCPHWKSVTELSWRQFNFFDCTTSFHRYLDDGYKTCLIRCGPSLKKIYFPPLLNNGKTSELLGIIARHCPNVESAVLMETRFKKQYAKDFTRILSRLTCLEIESSGFELTYDLLKQIFKRVSKLKSLTFKGYDTKTTDILAMTFQFLPKSLTAAHFGRLSYPDVEFFVLLLKRCPNLEVLTMSGEPDEETGADIAKFKNLKELELHNCEMSLPSVSHILSLKLLEKLVLTCLEEMTDEFLEKIADSLPLLKHLDVHAAQYADVTDEGVEKLAQLKHLEHLNLSYYNLMTDRGVGAVAANGRLKDLVLISTLVTDDVISSVVTPCLELRLLDLSACSEITEEAVTALLELFNPTNERAQLIVIIGGTECVKSDLRKDEDGDENLEDIFATNLSILKNTNSVNSKLLRRYGGIYDDDSDDFDDEEFDDLDEYDFSDNEDFSDGGYDYEDEDFVFHLW